MNLDPTVSPWIGVFASTGVCLWMAAVGAPLARAVFGDRPRPVWPFYAPALGIVAVLLTTNLSAYVIPGTPSAWFGLLAPSALAAFVAWRVRLIRRPSLPHRTGVADAPAGIHRHLRTGLFQSNTGASRRGGLALRAGTSNGSRRLSARYPLWPGRRHWLPLRPGSAGCQHRQHGRRSPMDGSRGPHRAPRRGVNSGSCRVSPGMLARRCPWPSGPVRCWV